MFTDHESVLDDLSWVPVLPVQSFFFNRHPEKVSAMMAAVSSAARIVLPTHGMNVALENQQLIPFQKASRHRENQHRVGLFCCTEIPCEFRDKRDRVPPKLPELSLSGFPVKVGCGLFPACK